MVTQIGNAKATLDLPMTIFLGEPAFGECSVNNLENSPKKIRIEVSSPNCTANYVGKLYSIEQLNYQQNFTVTCSEGSSSVYVICFVQFSSSNQQPLSDKRKVQGKLKILSRLVETYNMF